MITDKKFNAGMDLIAHNYRTTYPLDVRFNVWTYIGKNLPDLTDEKFDAIINSLSRATYAPRLDEIKTELNHYRPQKKQYEAYCGECKKRYTTDEDYIAERECCPECFKWFHSAEGRTENAKRAVRLKKKIESMSESFTPPEEDKLAEYTEEF